MKTHKQYALARRLRTATKVQRLAVLTNELARRATATDAVICSLFDGLEQTRDYLFHGILK